MEKKFEGTFELFDLKVRRLRNGNKLRLVFEKPESLDEERQLIDFRGHYADVYIGKDKGGDSIDIDLEGIFEVFDIRVRRLKDGDKLQLVLECIYEKDREIELVKLRYCDCLVGLKRKEEKDLFEEEIDGE